MGAVGLNNTDPTGSQKKGSRPSQRPRALPAALMTSSSKGGCGQLELPFVIFDLSKLRLSSYGFNRTVCHSRQNRGSQERPTASIKPDTMGPTSTEIRPFVLLKYFFRKSYFHLKCYIY